MDPATHIRADAARAIDRRIFMLGLLSRSVACRTLRRRRHMLSDGVDGCGRGYTVGFAHRRPVSPATFDRTLKGLDTFKILNQPIQPLSCRSGRDRLTNTDEVCVPVDVPSNDKDGQ